MIQLGTMRAMRTIAFAMLLAALPALGSDHTPPPVEPATAYASFEVHQDEKVAIAAVPYDTKEMESIFRVNYVEYGVMPIRLIVTNNGDRPISLSDARILFQTAAGDRIQAAEPEDVERIIVRPRESDKPPLRSPIPGLHLPHKDLYKAIQEDFDTFEYGALVVEPHTTRAGFLFYDVTGLSDPLRGAKLHLHDLRNADGKQLFYFEIPLDKELKSRPAAEN